MAVISREYVFNVDKFNNPTKIEGDNAVGLRLYQLLTMNPGDNPLHPSMGIGIKRYRYGLNNIDEVAKVIRSQVETFLPMYQLNDIELYYSDNHVLNISIYINGVQFRYSTDMEEDKIYTLEDIKQ